MLNLPFFLNQNYSVVNVQCKNIIISVLNKLGTRLYVIFAFIIANLFAVNSVYASETHGREHKNIPYQKYERNAVYSNHRINDGERKYKKDKQNNSRSRDESTYQEHKGYKSHKRDHYRLHGNYRDHYSTSRHHSIKSPVIHRQSHQYYPHHEKKRTVKIRYPERYVSKRSPYYWAHEYKSHKKRYDKRDYSSRHYHKNEVAFLLGGIILGAVLADNGHYSKTHYSDGYKSQPYTRVRKNGCYEVAYEGRQRILVEVPTDYCQAN